MSKYSRSLLALALISIPASASEPLFQVEKFDYHFSTYQFPLSVSLTGTLLPVDYFSSGFNGDEYYEQRIYGFEGYGDPGVAGAESSYRLNVSPQFGVSLELYTSYSIRDFPETIPPAAVSSGVTAELSVLVLEPAVNGLAQVSNGLELLYASVGPFSLSHSFSTGALVGPQSSNFDGSLADIGNYQIISGEDSLIDGGTIGDFANDIVLSPGRYRIALGTTGAGANIAGGFANAGGQVAGERDTAASVHDGATGVSTLLWHSSDTWRNNQVPNGVGAVATISGTGTIGIPLNLDTDSGITLGLLAITRTGHTNVDGPIVLDGGGSGQSRIFVARAVASLQGVVTASSDLVVDIADGAELTIDTLTGVGGSVTYIGPGDFSVSKASIGDLHLVAGTMHLNDPVLVSRFASIEVDEGGSLDTGGASFVVDADGILASTLEDMITLLLSGRVLPSEVDIRDASGLPRTLAIYRAGDLGISDFRGIIVDEDAVIAEYAIFGDANVDGMVDALDYSVIDLAIGNVGVIGTAGGDLNLDGYVDALDYEQVDSNIGNALPIGGQLSPVTVVPEPSTTAVVLGITTGVLNRRRRS